MPQLKHRCLCLLLLLACQSVLGAGEPLVVSVDAPYIELHTGPGRGYPVFHVVERADTVEVLVRRTDWYRVRTRRGQSGWVMREQMAHTLTADGVAFLPPDAGFSDYAARRWEVGVLLGDFDGAWSLQASLGYRMTANLNLELNLTQVTGNYSDSRLLTLHVVQQPFPNWRFSPYVSLGAGVIHTEPSAVLVDTEDRSDHTLSAGAGLRCYLTRRFLLRLDYKNYLILTSREENEDANQWQLGLSVFF